MDGPNPDLAPLSESLSTKNIQSGFAAIRAKYNEDANKESLAREAHNKHIFSEWESGRIDDDLAAAQYRPMLKVCEGEVSKRFLRRWRRNWGWSRRVFHTPAKYLECNKPKVAEHRTRFKQAMEMDQVYCALVLSCGNSGTEARRPPCGRTPETLE